MVTAKLAYDRFKNYAARKDSVSKPVAGYYRRLNALPHSMYSTDGPLSDISPRCSGSSPERSAERLEQISAAIEAAASDFKVRLIQPRALN